MVNQDLRAVVVAQRLDEFKSVPAEPISVGDDNLLDISSVDASQKGLEVLSLVVEPRPDVFESLVVRIILFEELDLSLEVRGLLGRTDPCIDVALLFRVRFLCGSELSLDVSEVVGSFPSITESSDPYPPGVSPGDQGRSGYFIPFSNL